MENGKVEGKTCPLCGAEEVYISEDVAQIESEGKIIHEFNVKICTCDNCGAVVYHPDLDACNRLLTAEAVRSISENRLSLKQIRGLPVKYAIPRKYFNIVMEIPELHKEYGDSFPFKLFDGELPTLEEETRLRAIYEDPKIYVECLKRAEKWIPKDVYDKSMKAAMERVEKTQEA